MNQDSSGPTDAVSRDFFAAVSAGDLAAVRRIYHPEATIWHNFDNRDQSVEENLATLGGIPERYDEFGYIDIRESALADGFLRQHVIRAVRGDKVALVPAILRCYVADGQITRIEEYFDRGQLERALA